MKPSHISMHRRPTWDMSGGFQSKLDLIMQLTDERSLELSVLTVIRHSAGTRFTENLLELSQKK